MVAVAACVVVAVGALVLPVSPAYDPWAWLVWGREAVHLDLDTTGGPSWKPLPVLVAVVVSAFGDLAPEAWLAVARVGGLLALVGVYRLATRLAGPVAGVIATGLFVLTPDDGPRYARLVLEGHTAPFTATLTVWAVERHLAGRHGQTALLLTLLSLDRPEAWPFLGLYALWLGWREPRRRAVLAALLVAVPVLWFGGDWWGSGSPLHGADSAQVYTHEANRLGMALDHVRALVVLPAWVLSGVGGAVAWRRGRRDVAALVALAAAWLTLVVVMSVALGYAAIPRFMLPGAALVCVAAAVVAVSGARALPAGARRPLVLALVVAVSAPFVVTRSLAFGSLTTDVTDRGRAGEELVEVLDRAGGVDRLVACDGPLRMNTGTLPRTALAWHAGVPLHDVTAVGSRPTGVAVVTAGSPTDDRLVAATGTDTEGRPVELARHGAWVVYAIGCAEVDVP